MRVTFTKKRDPRHFPNWVAELGKRRIEGSHMGSDPRHLPHDIVTLVIERELGIRDGFFGTVAAGGTFKSMARPQKPSRRAAIARNRGGIDRAEQIVNRHWAAWLSGGETSCADALNNALANWKSVERGGTLTLDFLELPVHPAKRR